MSDFLGQLIARNLNQSPVLQPRVPSLFEPVSGAGVFASSSVETSRPAEPVSDPLTAPIQSLNRRTSAADSIARPHPANVETSLLIDPSLSPETSRATPPTSRPESPAVRPFNPEPDAAAESSKVIAPVARSMKGVETAQGSPGNFAPAPAAQIRPNLPPMSEPARRAEPAPRNIQITIGRVEVRAVLPASPGERRPAQSAPRLSLEQYLKRRNGARA